MGGVIPQQSRFSFLAVHLGFGGIGAPRGALVSYMGNKRFVHVDVVRQELGADTFVVLEPADVWQKKLAEGKQDQVWGFDLTTGNIRRGDGELHEAGMFQHPAGHWMAAVNEQPKVVELDEEHRRIVGHVIIEKNAIGQVRIRQNQGLNGPILELQPSSITKGELADAKEKPVGYMEANPQRIRGFIAVYVRTMEFAEGTIVMTPAEFVAQSTDGRSITALVKAGLLK